MSLINDALKKARQAQVKSPGRDSAPQLRPATTDHPVRSGPTWVLPAIIVAMGLIGAALVWAAISNPRKDWKSEPIATSRPAVLPGAEPVSAPKPVVVSGPPSPEPAIRASTPPPAEPAARSPEPAPPPVASEPVATVSAAKPTLKLDGIFFHPSRPTAIVNNKLVSPGSRVGDLTVLAITQNSVTLEGGGQTNVLSLSE